MEWNTRRPPLPRRDERDEQIDTRARSHALDFVVAAAEVLTVMCLVKGQPFAFVFGLRGRAYLQIREIRRKAVPGSGRMPWGRGRGASGVVRLHRLKGALPPHRIK